MPEEKSNTPEDPELRAELERLWQDLDGLPLDSVKHRSVRELSYGDEQDGDT